MSSQKIKGLWFGYRDLKLTLNGIMDMSLGSQAKPISF
jgi:hypothetical protein